MAKSLPSVEFVMSASLEVDRGGTGGKAVSESLSELTPTLFIGKGFAFLTESMKYLKPLAVTWQVGYSVSTKSSSIEDGEVELNAQSVVWGGGPKPMAKCFKPRTNETYSYDKSSLEDILSCSRCGACLRFRCRSSRPSR